MYQASAYSNSVISRSTMASCFLSSRALPTLSSGDGNRSSTRALALPDQYPLAFARSGLRGPKLLVPRCGRSGHFGLIQ